jgi:chromosomal replication initiation ATPase DnaA
MHTVRDRKCGTIEQKQSPSIHLHSLERWRLQLIAQHIVEVACSVTEAEVAGLRRGSRRVVLARHLEMYLLHIRGGLSQLAVGEIMQRDRRGIAYAIAAIERRREDDALFDTTVEMMELAMLRSVQVEAAAA